MTTQERVHRSTRVWTLYLDLEESLGTLETTKAAYDRCIELKVRSLGFISAQCMVIDG
jgi:pre-mRNA-splicing factor SYF1